MSRIVVISGGLGTPSSTRVLSGDIVARLDESLSRKGESLDATVVELRDLAHPIADAMLTGFPVGRLAEVVESLEGADALIVVSPTFSASVSGLVKSFFDILDPGILSGKPVLLAATGGTERHSLMIEYAMRPLLTYLGALPVRTGVFAATSDFGGPGATTLAARVTQAADELASAIVGTPRTEKGDGFVEFATLLGR